MIEAEFRVRDMRAAVGVGEERFRARRRPFDRLPELARRVADADVLGIRPDFHAESTPDIADDDAHALRRHLQNRGRHRHLEPLARLARDVDRVAFRRAIEIADDRAWLHRVRRQAVVDEVELRYVGCTRHRSPRHRRARRCLPRCPAPPARACGRPVGSQRSSSSPRAGLRIGRRSLRPHPSLARGSSRPPSPPHRRRSARCPPQAHGAAGR